MKLVRFLALWGLLLAVLAPSGASAASFNFFSNDGLGPTGGAGNVGRANHYPSEITVAGLPPELTKVTVTFPSFLSASPDDIDMLLISPEAEMVMLMSDACGNLSKGGMQSDIITFDDDATTVLPDDGPCPTKTVATVKPVNYVGDAEPDDFGVGGGVFAPFGTALADFIGEDPNGRWELYVLDDNIEVSGFELHGWFLTLTVPDPAGPPAPPTTTTQPASSTTTSTPPPAAGTTKAAKTGKRAAALAKCKLKKTKEKRVKCRIRARKLPV